MIHRVRLVKAIGQFDAVSTGETLDLRKLTVVYAENARGKTTLAAVLRSLATGEPLPIIERRRLGAAHAPEAIIDCTGESSPACFQDGEWSRTCPEVLVFDDSFVDQNVYSGMEIDADHRQNLHDLILGQTGVALAKRVNELAGRTRELNSVIRSKANEIPTEDRHGLSVDDFCALEVRENIDEAISEAEQRLSALQNAEAVRTTAEFSQLSLPEIDFTAVRGLLSRTIADLDRSAVEAVTEHFARLGHGGEAWIEEGMRLGAQSGQSALDNDCPFCAQSLRGSPIFEHYRAYFDEAYTQLQADLASVESDIERSLSGDALAGLERQVTTAEQLRRFWTRFADMPAVGIDTTIVATAWQQVRDTVLDAIRAKRADPLSAATLTEEAEQKIEAYERVVASVRQSSDALVAANEAVQRVKESVQSGSTSAAEAQLNRLRATKARHTPENVNRCDAYLQAKRNKECAVTEKAEAQEQLDQHRDTAMPNWETAVNTCLSRLGAGFTVARIESQATGGRPTCTYRLVINGHEVAIGPGTPQPGSPTFKNTLSSGDRNTLALAFFLSSLEQDPIRENRVVVLDDPMSSLDKHRRMNTIQALRTLLPTVAQVIVMSHDEYFLFDIYDRIAPRQNGRIIDTTTVHVRRVATGSTIVVWDIESEKMCRHDKRHACMTEFANGGANELLPVAQCIRPHLEFFLRAAYPQYFRNGENLRDFRNRARTAAANESPIISAEKFTELDQIVEYSNDFHHDTNQSLDTVVINDSELRNYVDRALSFVQI